jgi:hypothetical protein
MRLLGAMPLYSASEVVNLGRRSGPIPPSTHALGYHPPQRTPPSACPGDEGSAEGTARLPLRTLPCSNFCSARVAGAEEPARPGARGGQRVLGLRPHLSQQGHSRDRPGDAGAGAASCRRRPAGRAPRQRSASRRFRVPPCPGARANEASSRDLRMTSCAPICPCPELCLNVTFTARCPP